MSTKCRYGLRSLVDLAYYGRGGHVALHHIAKRQDISLKYLEQEFAVLRKAGIIRSVKGAQGGYSLSRPAHEITVAELVEILEGDLEIVDTDRDAAGHSPLRRCISDHVWQPLNQHISQRLQKLTLADLMHAFEEEKEPENMYYI